jgi:hypothetical protein
MADQLEVPFKDQWIRESEHETKMVLSAPGYRIVIEHPWATNDLEKWLVETLHIWPHPDAPRSEGEYDYPGYRNAVYAKLMQGAERLR